MGNLSRSGKEKPIGEFPRVSTEEQTRPNYSSLATQADICRAYVESTRRTAGR